MPETENNADPNLISMYVILVDTNSQDTFLGPASKIVKLKKRGNSVRVVVEMLSKLTSRDGIVRQ